MARFRWWRMTANQGLRRLRRVRPSICMVATSADLWCCCSIGVTHVYRSSSVMCAATIRPKPCGWRGASNSRRTANGWWSARRSNSSCDAARRASRWRRRVRWSFEARTSWATRVAPIEYTAPRYSWTSDERDGLRQQERVISQRQRRKGHGVSGRLPQPAAASGRSGADSYPNKASAADLSDGSATVLVEGNPTALKDQSYISTSSGDEGGTQGGGVVTHKTKGKGYFQFWSFDVMIEGLNADGHSDPMGQNCGSKLNGLCLRSSVVRDCYAAAEASDCTEAYSGPDHHVDPNTAQKKQAKAEHKSLGGICWECRKTCPPPSCMETHVDHFPPLVVQWYAGAVTRTIRQRIPTRGTSRRRTRVVVRTAKAVPESKSRTMAKFNSDMITKLGL